jgi:hypothetical protein
MSIIKTKSKAIKKSTRSDARQKYEENTSKAARANELGVDGDTLKEGIPKYISSLCEQVIQGENNAWIVLGRDRPATRASGYGATADTHAGAIDVVVGRMGHNAAGFRAALPGKPPERIETDVDFVADAARIYISQKTDVDKNFNLKPGRVGTSNTKSAIGIKADAVRIIAREGIKLVTKTDIKNSQGSDVVSITGVDIIAGNDDSDLQPMVKGVNLQNALNRLATHLEALNGIVDSFLMIQMDYNAALQHHVHISPFFACPTEVSPSLAYQEGPKTLVKQLTRVKRSLKTHKENVGAWKSAYLEQTDKKYINSRYNNVN